MVVTSGTSAGTGWRRWGVQGVRSGVRALPPRTGEGALPLAGRLRADRPWWVVAGLVSPHSCHNSAVRYLADACHAMATES